VYADQEVEHDLHQLGRVIRKEVRSVIAAGSEEGKVTHQLGQQQQPDDCGRGGTGAAIISEHKATEAATDASA
jgi:hypothetical protein